MDASVLLNEWDVIRDSINSIIINCIQRAWLVAVTPVSGREGTTLMIVWLMTLEKKEKKVKRIRRSPPASAELT